MKYVFVLLSLFIFSIISSQDIKTEVQDSSYHNFRMLNNLETFNSYKKIKKIISELELKNKELKDSLAIISDSEFNKLSIKEKLAYTLLYSEQKSESLFKNEIPKDEENKIFAYLPYLYNAYDWSDRQHQFLENNSKVILPILKEVINKEKHIGLNIKKTLEDLNAVDMIPFLTNFYNTSVYKDKDILTLLMLLVRNNNYYPFVRSNIYRELYQSDLPIDKASVEYNPLNEEYIIKTAHNFYIQTLKKHPN